MKRLIVFVFLCVMVFPAYMSANQHCDGGGGGFSKPFKYKKYKKNLLLEARLYYGFLLQHHTEMEPLGGHLPAFELSLVYNSFGKREWQKWHRYPYISYNLFYSPLTGHKALGEVYGFYPSLSIPIAQDKKQYFAFRPGLGIAYLTEHFHPLNNYKNLAIGSHFNIFINLMLDYRRHLTPNTDVSVGLGLIHFSNGGMASPNYGINLPTMSLSVSKKISRQNRRLYIRRPDIPVFGYKDNKIFIYSVQGAYATKDMGNVVGEKYDVYNGSVSVLKRLNMVHAVGLSVDGVWDGYHKKALEDKFDSIQPTFSQVLRIGVAPTYEVKFSNLIASMGVGFYVSGEDSSEGVVYETVALKYLVYKNVYLLVNLRAHAARAAFLGWGIGYRLQWDHGKLRLP